MVHRLDSEYALQSWPRSSFITINSCHLHYTSLISVGYERTSNQKGSTTLVILTDFFSGMITFMMMKTVKMCKGFPILNAFIGFLFYDEVLGNLKMLHNNKIFIKIYAVVIFSWWWDCRNMRRLHYIKHTYRSSLHCNLFHAFEYDRQVKAVPIAYIHRVSFQYVFFYVFEDDCNV